MDQPKPPKTLPKDKVLQQLQDLLDRAKRGEITSIHAIFNNGEPVRRTQKKAPGPKRGG